MQLFCLCETSPRQVVNEHLADGSMPIRQHNIENSYLIRPTTVCTNGDMVLDVDSAVPA